MTEDALNACVGSGLDADRLCPAALPDASPYGRLGRRGRKWYVFDARPDAAMRLRRLFPGVSARDPGALPLPASMPGFWVEMNWYMKRYPLSVASVDRAAATKAIARELEHARDVVAFTANASKPAPLDLPLRRPLRQYQLRAVEAIALQRRLLLADDVGLGKTAVAIASITKERAFPALFVTMTQLTRQTVREFAKFVDTVCVTRGGRWHAVDETTPLDAPPAPDVLVVHAIDGLTPYALPPADVYVMKYSCLRGWDEALAEGRFRYVVFDECQELRRRGTAKLRAARKAAVRADYCLGMTATPIYNYGDEIYTVLHLLRPNCLGRLSEFVAEWGKMTPFRKVVIQEPAALGAMLREHLLMLRRTKAEVGLELPEVQCAVEYVDHDVKRFNQSMGEILELAKRTLFGWSHEERMTASGRMDVQLRHATGVAKAHYVAARTRILLESGRSVVLVGWHRDTYTVWNRELADHNPVMITGSESPEQKDANKRAFIRGDADLLILSLRSGEGMDGLQERCSIVVFGELDWSPQIHHQIIGRLHRYGQKESVLALFLLSREGTDPAIADILDLKSEQAFRILNPTEGFHPQLETPGAAKQLDRIAEDMLRRYKVDLDEARRAYETKEPDGLWAVLAGIEAFRGRRTVDEKSYQADLHAWLTTLGAPVRREVRVGGGVIDLLTEDGVGIEVKLARVSTPAVVRQIRSYLEDDAVRAIVVLRPDPGGLPDRLLGKRVVEAPLHGNPALSA